MNKHRSLPPVLAALLAAAVALSACGPPDGPNLEEICQQRLAGDLVISEFLADPDGEDTGQEWIEIFNASGDDIDLAGFSLFNADQNGGAEKKHTFKSVLAPRGAYLVVGDVRDANLPQWVNYSYGTSLAALRNTSGTLGIRCGAKLLDEVKYTKVNAARSRQLSGGFAPDSVVNDQEINWCSTATAEPKYDGKNAGTPGQPNTPCGDTSSGTCVDPATGQSRPIRYPAAGELVITEVMADPAAVGDTEGEWVEVLALEAIDLNGLSFTGNSSKSTVISSECLPVQQGAYAVIARSADPLVNGGLPAVHATYATALPNSNATLSVHAGTTLVDETSWTTTKAGVARQLSSDKLTAVDNDNPGAFCDAKPAYGAGDKGTPGAPNEECTTVVPPTCEGKNAGDLVITEIMANPTGVDTGKEYFEIYNTTGAAIDLGGMTLRYSRADGSAPKTVVLGEAIVPAGAYFTLGDVPNDALPAHLDYGYGTGIGALNNTDGTFALSCGTTLVDEATYGSVKENAARVFDGSLAPDAIANDDPGAWCDAKVVSGTYLGSPRTANEACGTSVAGCVDAVSGTLRPRVKPAPERLIVSEVMANPAGTDADREWFELFAFDDMDLNGVVISRDTQTSTTRVTLNREECMSVTAGSYVVVARKATPEVNGGIASPIATFNFTLSNGATLFVHQDGALIDLAKYPSGPTDVSQELSADRLTAFVNDSPYAWCPGEDVYGAGGKGTPGLANRTCPSPVAPGECRDALTSQPRAILRPVVGDLVFTEVMAQPTPLPGAPNDRPREWFELASTAVVDLNEVEVGNELGGAFRLEQAACHALQPGSHVLYAQSTVTAQNGGLPAPTFVFDFDLANAGTTANPERAVIVRSEGTELDRYSWTTSALGASDQLSLAVALTPANNDVPANRCTAPATASYGDGDLGTPGAPNVLCP